MITNTGKDIIAKYLIGQAPAYASYIAVGCGARPLASDATLDDYSEKRNLDFEMFRVPIVSRGYVNENNISKIVFTADSDAILTKGIIAVLIRAFSNQKPAAILEANTDFIDEIGLKEHLSPTRANGLVSMIKQIKMYALAFEAKN
jgi:hypothetical protein